MRIVAAGGIFEGLKIGREGLHGNPKGGPSE